MMRRRFLPLSLSCLLAAQGQTGGGATQAQPQPRLAVSPLTGLEPKLSIGRLASEPRVRVVDEQDAPVRGATVSFEVLPQGGAGAFFAKGATVFSTQSDDAGEAAATGLRPNNRPGKFRIRITASAPKAAAGTTTIEPENILEIRRLTLEATGGVSYLCDAPAGAPKITPPRVVVSDERGQAVVGAAVAFTLPERGPSGIFTGGRRTLETQTNEQGHAVAAGFRPNKTNGRFGVKVRACLMAGFCEGAEIGQSNVKKGCFPVVPVTILVLTGGGLGGACAARLICPKPPPPPPPPVGITPGAPVFGRPR